MTIKNPLLELKFTKENGFPTLDDFINISVNCDTNTREFFTGINTWLLMQNKSHSTFRAYKKEVERFVLWSVLIKKKSPFYLEIKDVVSYSKFLSNVVETHPKWCGPRYSRSSNKWKPFYCVVNHKELPKDNRPRGLSNVSHDSAITILSSLFSWLDGDNIVNKNVFKLAKNKNKSSCEQLKVARAFSWDEVKFIFRYINNSTDDLINVRRLWVFQLMIFTGMRCSEIANTTYGAFMKDSTGYYLQIKGKGNKLRLIPVNQLLEQAMINYRSQFGLSTYPAPGEKIPLVFALKSFSKVSVRTINSIVSSTLQECAQTIKEDSYLKNKLMSGSPHWFRGSFASEVNKQGVNQKTLQDLMGHSSPNTTARYLLIDNKDKVEAVSQIRKPF